MRYGDTCGKCGAVRIDQQIGLEGSLDAYITALIEVFRAVWRVLRDDGTVWLNLGDSYAGSWGAQGRDGQMADRTVTLSRNLIASHPHQQSNTGTIRDAGLKPKDLMMVPARVALALQADGWWIRSDVIWAKKAPMPESVTDRPTSAHEHVFLLTKKPRYFYDAEAVKEPIQTVNWKPANGANNNDSAVTLRRDGTRHGGGQLGEPSGRNLRNVWHLGPSPFPDAHFATFPPALVEPCIKAGTSERGCCAACGAPWVRVMEREGLARDYTAARGVDGNWRGKGVRADTKMTNKGNACPTTQTLGWHPTCRCAADIHPCTILDPFAGSGTVGLVADRLGRNSILIELSPTYAAMAKDRIVDDCPLFTEVTTT